MSLFKKRLNLQVPDELMSVMHYIGALDLSPQRAVDGMMDHGLEWAERGLAALDALIQVVSKHSGSVASDDNGFGESWESSAQAALFLGKVKDSLSTAITRGSQEGLSEYPSIHI